MMIFKRNVKILHSVAQAAFSQCSEASVNGQCSVYNAHVTGFAHVKSPAIPLAIGTASTILDLRSGERGKCCSCIAKPKALEKRTLEKTE